MSRSIGSVAPPAAECAPREAIRSDQMRRLTELLRAIDGRNRFYARKYVDAGVTLADLKFPADLHRLPFTTKAQLVADQDATPPWGTALTEPVERYTRYHQTSSTTGRPLRWLDTNKNWQWMLECWKAVYRGARVDGSDRIFFPFSFGPFLGFWTAFEAGTQLGAHCVPAGGMDSRTRLTLINALRPTVVCCTPTYALRLLEVAREMATGDDRPLAGSAVRVLIVAGEPGGSIPVTRQQIEEGWGARVIDHHGLTEVGPISFECWENPGYVHLNEREFLCEVIDSATERSVIDGQLGELVVTTLGRTASPVIRYRTGDLVRLESETCACGRSMARLRGGILSRVDDMVCIRGVNVYPGAVEAIVRAVREVIEYRATIGSTGALGTITLDIEIDPASNRERVVELVGAQLREGLGLTVPVAAVAPGTLPRFEMKSRRFIVETSHSNQP